LGALDAADDQRWQLLRQHRHATLVEREAHDTAWRTAHQALRQAAATEPLPTAWRAILRVTDNCTRQCYELPLFASGGRVSAAEVVTSVARLLPTTVHVVISDQGTHFMAKVFQQLAARAGFVHVPIAHHRPESNGIAERCVRTLKAWLRQYAWNSDEELLALLAQFVTDYNECPHQGLGIPGLSPNEFTKRVWLF
jgi:transposase InsO family protein